MKIIVEKRHILGDTWDYSVQLDTKCAEYDCEHFITLEKNKEKAIVEMEQFIGQFTAEMNNALEKLKRLT